MATWAESDTPFVDPTLDSAIALDVRPAPPTAVQIRPRRPTLRARHQGGGDRFFALLLLAFLLPIVALIALLIR